MVQTIETLIHRPLEYSYIEFWEVLGRGMCPFVIRHTAGVRLVSRVENGGGLVRCETTTSTKRFNFWRVCCWAFHWQRLLAVSRSKDQVGGMFCGVPNAFSSANKPTGKCFNVIIIAFESHNSRISPKGVPHTTLTDSPPVVHIIPQQASDYSDTF
jgi:hypothetical protein